MKIGIICGRGLFFRKIFPGILREKSVKITQPLIPLAASIRPLRLRLGLALIKRIFKAPTAPHLDSTNSGGWFVRIDCPLSVVMLPFGNLVPMSPWGRLLTIRKQNFAHCQRPLLSNFKWLACNIINGGIQWK